VDKKCPKCPDATLVTVLTPQMSHYGRLICSNCYRHVDWAKKPENEGKKRRASKHRDLVAKYSKGYCQLCMRKIEELPPKCVLTAHHVERYCENGSAEPDNIWIVCTDCHSLIEWARRTLGKCREHQNGNDTTGVEGPETMGLLEDSQTGWQGNENPLPFGN